MCFRQSKVLSFISLALLARSAFSQGLDLPDAAIRQHANNSLALMAFAVVPDLTSSFLSISGGEGENSKLKLTQLAGGASLKKGIPLYLEGGLGYARYDPKFLASDGSEVSSVPAKWNILSATGGVGYDFSLGRNLVIRPILNFSLGQVASDLSLAARYLEWKTGHEIDFLDGGKLNAYGLGGSLMLDYELITPEQEIDIEFRYTNMRLKSFSGSSAVQGSASAEAISLYARRRTPTGVTFLQRPLRFVTEVAHTAYLGSQRGLLGFNYLTSLGGGLEVDSSAYTDFPSRVRLVARYAFGKGVQGVDVGLALSF